MLAVVAVFAVVLALMVVLVVAVFAVVLPLLVVLVAAALLGVVVGVLVLELVGLVVETVLHSLPRPRRRPAAPQPGGFHQQ